MKSQSASDAALMLFEKHGDEVYRYVRYTIGNQSDTEDIVQEIFLRVLQSWKQFNHRAKPKTWLWSITNNCIREHLRKTEKQQSRNIPFAGEFEFPEEREPNHDLEMLRLEESLQQLNVSERQVFIERIVHKKSTAETAKDLGWGQSKVRTTLHRARNKIKAVMRKEVDALE